VVVMVFVVLVAHLVFVASPQRSVRIVAHGRAFVGQGLKLPLGVNGDVRTRP
jgi:hypothetical protein